MERPTGIEPASSVWKTDVSTSLTRTAKDRAAEHARPRQRMVVPAYPGRTAAHTTGRAFRMRSIVEFSTHDTTGKPG